MLFVYVLLKEIRIAQTDPKTCGTNQLSAGLPACLIGRCCSCSVLGLCWFLSSLATRFCFVWIVSPPFPSPSVKVYKSKSILIWSYLFLLSGFHLACTSTSLGGNLSPLPPCPLPCSGLLSSQRRIHSVWRYFARAVLIWYTVNRLLRPALATQTASVLRLCLRLPFFFLFLLILSFFFFSLSLLLLFFFFIILLVLVIVYVIIVIVVLVTYPVYVQKGIISFWCWWRFFRRNRIVHIPPAMPRWTQNIFGVRTDDGRVKTRSVIAIKEIRIRYNSKPMQTSIVYFASR